MTANEVERPPTSGGIHEKRKDIIKINFESSLGG